MLWLVLLVSQNKYLPQYFKLIGDSWADLVLRFVKDCRNRINYGKFYFLKSLFAEKRTSGERFKEIFNSNLKHLLLLYLSTPRRLTGYWVTVLLVFYFSVTVVCHVRFTSQRRKKKRSFKKLGNIDLVTLRLPYKDLILLLKAHACYWNSDVPKLIISTTYELIFPLFMSFFEEISTCDIP